MKKQKYYIYGKHACFSIILNGSRVIHKIFCTPEVKKILDQPEYADKVSNLNISIVDYKYLNKLLSDKEKHQGISMQTGSLIQKHDFSQLLKKGKLNRVLILDQVQDPQNVGAIIRTSFCFNVDAIIMSEKNSPEITSSVVRASAGYSEAVPIFKSNLASAIKELKKGGFFIFGMDGRGSSELPSRKIDDGKTAIIMGSEGSGMRSLTRSLCDDIFYIKMNPEAESLNVATAAAIAIHSLFR